MTDIAIVRLGIGLVLLIAANIALGSVNAFMEGTWDMMKFRNGCVAHRGVLRRLAEP